MLQIIDGVLYLEGIRYNKQAIIWRNAFHYLFGNVRVRRTMENNEVVAEAAKLGYIVRNEQRGTRKHRIKVEEDSESLKYVIRVPAKLLRVSKVGKGVYTTTFENAAYKIEIKDDALFYS